METKKKYENSDRASTEALLKANYFFFASQLPNLLKDEEKRNKIALIKDMKIIGFYEGIEEAINVAEKEKNFEPETFIIQKIEPQETQYISRRLYP